MPADRGSGGEGGDRVVRETHLAPEVPEQSICAYLCADLLVIAAAGCSVSAAAALQQAISPRTACVTFLNVGTAGGTVQLSGFCGVNGKGGNSAGR